MKRRTIGLCVLLGIGGLLVGHQRNASGQNEPRADATASAVPEEVTVACRYLDRCLERLKQEPETEWTGLRVTSILQSAERTLPIFWGVDVAVLPADLRKKIDAYPEAIGMWVDRVNESKSAKALIVVKQIVSEYEAWRMAHQSEKWQAFIDQDEQVIKSMQKWMAKMTAGPSLDAADALLLKQLELLNTHKQGQFSDYQKNAIKRSHQFVDFCLTNTIGFDGTLLREFNASDTAKIDPSLLNANARKMYETAISMMESKLSPAERAKFLLRLAETPTWSLRDF